MSDFKLGDKVYLECEVTDIDRSDNTYRLAFEDFTDEELTIGWVDKEVLHPVNESYNRGLNDAWELAKKIVINSDDGGYTANELEEMFRTIFPDEVFADFSPQEALAKVKAYEEERNEIKVGDVVTIRGGVLESIVTLVDGCIIHRLFRDGSCDCGVNKEDLKKIGHFDSIDEFMRSTDD